MIVLGMIFMWCIIITFKFELWKHNMKWAKKQLLENKEYRDTVLDAMDI